MSLETDFRSVAPGTLLELFVLDLTPLGESTVFRFFSGLDEGGNGSISFGGYTYTPWPIAADGFGKSTDGPFPRPTLSVGNATGYISSLVRAYDDLIGAEVRRIRTVYKYTDGGTSPDGTAFAEDVFTINRRKAETKEVVVFELVASIDLAGKKLPGRVMIANTCTWEYKKEGCNWPGTNPVKWFDRDGNPVGTQAEDVCGQRHTDCKLRFGENAELPYGGFPATGRV